MRRSLARLPSCTIPIGSASSGLRQSAFSTSSSGRGRGGPGFPNEFSVVPPPKPADSKDELSSPEQPQPQPPPLGHGRGKPLPPFSASVNNQPPSSSAGRGRGRGSGPAPPQPSSHPVAHEFTPPPPPPPPPPQPTIHKPEEPNLPSSIFSVLSGAGRGKPVKPPESSPDKPKQQENRHVRSPRQLQGTPSAGATTPSPQPQRLSRDEAIKKAVGILSRGDEQAGSAGGRGGGRGGFKGRGGRGRGMFGRGGRGGRGEGRAEVRDDDYATGLYLGDNADGEKLAERLGADMMNKLVEGFEEMSSTVLPSPVDDLYLDALHTNLMIECEPEYLMGEFGQNPDIDEKPPIPLRDALEKMKPFLMAYEGIQSQQEWEEVVQETMERVPLIKAIVDHYSGPDRVTAKQQQEELERVAKTLPESAPASVKRFTDRAVLSLQSNPGWGFDKKCQFMDKLVWEVSQQYK